MAWHNPLPYRLIPTADSESFRTMPAGATGLPIEQHPGAFGVQRLRHVHEGVDLYAAQGMPVMAVEAGEVIDVRLFTGPALGHDWWLPTYGVWVEGESGIVLYGEIAPHTKVGRTVVAGEVLGVVTRVLKKDKGRPMHMLHLELRERGHTEDIEWYDASVRPEGLLDPTPFLLTCADR